MWSSDLKEKVQIGSPENYNNCDLSRGSEKRQKSKFVVEAAKIAILQAPRFPILSRCYLYIVQCYSMKLLVLASIGRQYHVNKFAPLFRLATLRLYIQVQLFHNSSTRINNVGTAGVGYQPLRTTGVDHGCQTTTKPEFSTKQFIH